MMICSVVNPIHNTRRQFLSRGTFGVGSLALACLLRQEKLLAGPHIFGLNHNELTFLHNGQEQRLTDNQSCRVVHEIFS